MRIIRKKQQTSQHREAKQALKQIGEMRKKNLAQGVVDMYEWHGLFSQQKVVR